MALIIAPSLATGESEASDADVSCSQTSSSQGGGHVSANPTGTGASGSDLDYGEANDTALPRFRSFEPNFIVQQFNGGNDEALKAHFSFRYLVLRPESEGTITTCRNAEKSELSWKKLFRLYSGELFLSYTGEFDFFWGGKRHSSPVVNRISNPAMHWRPRIPRRPFKGFKYVDLAFQHLSNGQTRDSEDIEERFALHGHRDPILDQISRDVDFLSVEISGRLGPDAATSVRKGDRCGSGFGCWDVWLRKAMHYEKDYNPVTWGPEAGRKHIADYHRWRLIVESQKELDMPFFKMLGFAVQLTVGDSGFQDGSADIYANLTLGTGRVRFPLTFACHYGPMATLASYTRRENWCGVGFRFD